MKTMSQVVTGILFALSLVAEAQMSGPPPAPPRNAGVVAAPATGIASVTPVGVTDSFNQVRVVFKTQMVTENTMWSAQRDLFSVVCTPQMKGRGSWIDTKTFVYQFETALGNNMVPGGTKCTATPKANVVDVNNKAVNMGKPFSFTVEGPNIISATPQGDQINEDQAMVLLTDAVIAPQEVLSKIYFRTPDKGSNVGIQFVEEPIRSQILKVVYLPNDYRKPGDARVLVIKAKDRFTPGSKISLVLDQKVKAADGKVGRTRNQVIPLQVRKTLAASLSCSRTSGPEAGCNPLEDINVSFSGNIDAADLAKIRLVDINTNKQYPAAVSGVNESNTTNQSNSVNFLGPFPPNAKFKVVLPSGIKDDAGRELSNSEEVAKWNVGTEEYPPLAKFNAEFGIVEAEVKPVVLPATLRNVEAQVLARITGTTADQAASVTGKVAVLGSQDMPQIVRWLKKVNLNLRDEYKNRENSIFASESFKGTTELKVPIQNNGKAFEVVGLPLSDHGFHVVELQSTLLGKSLLGKNAPMYVPTSALVTNLGVHLKKGRESSIAWVTQLDSGNSVAGAKVSVADCAGKTVWSSISDQSGLVTIDPGALKLAQQTKCADYNSPDGVSIYDNGFFVTVSSGKDFSFVHSGWTQGLDPYRFSIYSWDGYDTSSGDKTITHTILDRPMYRAGETVYMKNIVRALNGRGFAAAQPKAMPDKGTIQYDADQEKTFPLDISWNTANGTSALSFQIPKDAPLGSYSVMIGGRYTASFQVDEFKLPSMTGILNLPKQPLISPDNVTVNLNLNYLNQGPVKNKPVLLKYKVLDYASTIFKSFQEFSFGARPVIEGVQPSRDDRQTNDEPIVRKVQLDGNGSANEVISNIPKSPMPQTLQTEMEFQDSNKESQTVSKSTTLWSAGVLVGTKMDEWMVGQKFNFKAAVVDTKGQPVHDAKLTTEVFRSMYHTHRNLIPGGFYGGVSVTEIERVKDAKVTCAAPDKRGMANCSVETPVAGNIIVQISTSDSAGRKAYGQVQASVRGKARGRFLTENSDRIDLIPEKKAYDVGDTAKLEVQTPYQQANALVTVEREGVLKAWVQKIDTTNPTVQVPIEDGYAPNVFVSTFLVSGRISGDPSKEETAFADLGRPGFKMGLAELTVNWKEHALKVNVNPEKAQYKPRDTVNVQVQVTAANGKPLPANSEFALAVVDEALLQLRPNTTWDILRKMMGRRGYEVSTATAQMQIVGKRHYGLKALPSGGGGGKGLTRELFDTLIFWAPSVKTDAQGHAQVQFKLNDSMTKFKVVAIATSGNSMFGTGDADVISTKDVIILPGMPQLARSGDEVSSQLTVRNTTKQGVNLDVKGQVVFTMADGKKSAPKEIGTKTISVGPEQTVNLDIGQTTLPTGAVNAQYSISAVSKENADLSDSLSVPQKVVPAVPVRAQMATLEQVRGTVTQVVELPTLADPTQGGVKINLSSSLSNNLGSVQDYMNSYLYQTLEYMVSRAVVSGSTDQWSAVLKVLPNYTDDMGRLKYFPTSKEGSELLTAYVLSVAQQALLGFSDDTRTRLLGALKASVAGQVRKPATGLPNDYEQATRIKVMEALARYNALEPGLIKTLGKVTTNQLSNSSLVSWLGILLRVPKAENRAKLLAEAESAVKARLNYQGTKAYFLQNQNAYWLMSSSASEMSQLTLALMNFDPFKASWKNDVPKMILGLIEDLKKGAGSWGLTTANAWGSLAIRNFSSVYESQKVSGETRLALAEQSQIFNWANNPKGGEVNFAWPQGGRGQVSVTHNNNDGAPWSLLVSSAAVPTTVAKFNGFTVDKKVTPLRQEVNGKYSVGDRVQVKLTFKANASAGLVAVYDPVPTGARILRNGCDESRDSNDSEGAWPSNEEFGYESYRAYYDYIPTQEFSRTYCYELTSPGTFKVPGTRIEAVYNPTMFGEFPNESITVGASKQ